jgi:hypothetical protein
VEYLEYILTKILSLLKGKGEETDQTHPVQDIKFGDIHNKEYINNLTQTLDEYKYYILVIIGVAAIGILTYTYWDSIMNQFRRGDRGGEEDFYLTPSPSIESSNPSSGNSASAYPEGYLRHFSKKTGDLVEQVKARAQDLFNKAKGREELNPIPIEHISSNVGIPQGLYREGNQIMWQGLPVPRVENSNGVDYYISVDKDKFINIVDSTRGNEFIDVINPISGHSIGLNPIPLNSKINLLTGYRDWPEFISPVNSIVRNRKITNLWINNPRVSSTSVPEESLPSFEDIPLNVKPVTDPIPIPNLKGKGVGSAFRNRPKKGVIISEEEILKYSGGKNSSPTSSGSITPTEETYASGSITPRQMDFENNWSTSVDFD